MKPDQELLEIIRAQHDAAVRHSGWQAGPERIFSLLQVPLQVRQRLSSLNGGADTPPWESVLALLIRWHHEIPTGEGTISEEDASEIGLAALTFARADSITLALRRNGYNVRKSDGSFVLRHRWNPAVEVADMLLEQAALPDIPGPTPEERDWVESSRAGRERPPDEVLAAAAERSARTIVAYRAASPEATLSDSFDLGDGLTVGHACEILAALMGLADLREYAARRWQRTETTLIQLPRLQLVELLDKLSPSCSTKHVATAVDRLTYRLGRTPRNSPLVEIGERIVVTPPLVSSRLVDPLLLRAAAYDPARFGPIGRQLGRQIQPWVDWFTRVPGVLVATEVKLIAAGGRTVGDFDIVAVDFASATVVCLEVKTPIEAWSSAEVGKSEDLASKGARQLADCRTQLASGEAAARFPTSWPDLDGCSWTWAVGMPHQLTLQASPVPDMAVTTLRYLLSLGTPPNLSAIARVLRDPPLPEVGVHFAVKPITFHLDKQKIRVDSLAVRRDVPFAPVYPSQ